MNEKESYDYVLYKNVFGMVAKKEIKIKIFRSESKFLEFVKFLRAKNADFDQRYKKYHLAKLIPKELVETMLAELEETAVFTSRRSVI